MTTKIEFEAWLDSPLTKALKQSHKEAMIRFENTCIDKAVKEEREACANAAGPEDSYQDEWFNAKADSVKRIRARSNT